MKNPDDLSVAATAFAEAVRLATEGTRRVADPAGHPGDLLCWTAVRTKMTQASEALECLARARHEA